MTGTRGQGPLRVILLAIGLALSLLMVARSQVGGDQLNLLARGWLLAEEGRWVQHGNPTSAGGAAAGGLTSLLVGLPLMLWRDYRAPALLLSLLHLAGFLLLDRTLRAVLRPAERLLLLILLWLAPWRLYFSGFLWNPNYLFFFGVAHLATARAMRAPRFWPSLLHVTAMGAAVQLHPAAVMLAFASLVLYMRRQVRPHWWGVAIGAMVVAASLVPWMLELAAHPELVPAGKGFFGRGLLLVFPFVRGVGYWLRYASLSFSDRMVRFDFGPAMGEADAWLAPVATVLVTACQVTLLLALAANLRLVRRLPSLRRPLGDAGGRLWLRGYLLATLVGAAAAFAVSPTTVMYWQGFAALHAAVLVLVVALGAVLRTRWRPAVVHGARAIGAISVLLALAMALASPHYRRGGRETLAIALRGDHPMLHDLGLLQRTQVSVARPGGWWPDVLPEPELRTAQAPPARAR